MSILPHMIIIFTAFAGFLLSFHIWQKKRSSKTLTCPLGADCDTVIHSKYGRFFGIPLEYLGGGYYFVIAISYAIFIVQPALATPFFLFAIVVLSILGFLFSLYLTAIQGFVLKEWCSWCLMSAGLTTVIFIFALASSSIGFTQLLADHQFLIVIAHLFGLALGLGGATIGDIFFFRFLSDFRISEKESSVMHILSQIIWFGLATLVLSGLGLYIPLAAELSQDPIFILKMLMVTVLIFNGVLLNFIVSPKLIHISFRQKHTHHAGELHHLRRLAFAFGAISLTTWYGIFIISTTKQYIGYNFWALFAGYVLVLIIAIIISQIAEHQMVHRGRHSKQ